MTPLQQLSKTIAETEDHVELAELMEQTMEVVAEAGMKADGLPNDPEIKNRVVEHLIFEIDQVMNRERARARERTLA